MTLNEALAAFLADLSRHSPNTVRAYSLAVRQLGPVIDDPDFSVEELTTEHILAAIRQINVRNVSPNTLASYVTGICCFTRFLVLERMVGFDLIEFERMRQRIRAISGSTQRRLPAVPSDDAVHAIIQAARNVDPTTSRLALLALRNVALLETLRSTGARVSEIVGLKRSDLRLDERSAKVLGKGNKERFVFFDNLAWMALMEYLDLRDDGHVNGQPVFARHDRTTRGKLLPMTANAVRNVVTQFTVEAGVDEYMHPHGFRHRLATKVLTATGNLAATQDILGHANPATTRIYARLTGEALRKAHDAAGA